jgi:hypothetical protein
VETNQWRPVEQPVEHQWSWLGHEGHSNQTLELSSNELRTLLPTISLMAELPPAEDVPFLRGLWFGWTRKQF